jgi:phenylpropionate dioxygenase-like ring-hydroxylating dioxygenase large terminal subunit
MLLDPSSFKSSGSSLESIVQSVLAGSGQSIEQAETLPREAYTSQAFFDLETEAIFRKDWICVGHIAQIPNVGDYFTVDVLDELLMVVRGADRIRVLSRICLHRWAPVATGEGNTRLFSCPFHRWAYGLDGQLVAAPLMESSRDFDIKDCRLPEVRSEVVDGVIYISFDKTAYSIGERLSDLSEFLAPYGMEDLVVGWQVDYVCNFNWKIAVETFMECYHHIGAHNETAEPLYPARLTRVDDSRAGWTICTEELRPEVSTEEALGGGMPSFPHLTEEELRRDYLILAYPLTLMAVTPARIGVIGLIPVSPQKTIWRRNMLVPRSTMERADFQEKMALAKAFADRIVQEDMAVNDMQQIGAHSSLAMPGRLSELEKVVWQLADFVRDRIRN